MATRLDAIIRDVARERMAVIEALEVTPDHVHLIVDIDPRYGIHRLVKQMKGCSFRLLRQEFPRLRQRLPTLWTNSYRMFTVGDAPFSVPKQYVENQQRG